MLVKFIEVYLIIGLVLTGFVMYLVSNNEQYKEEEYSIPVIALAVIIFIVTIPAKTLFHLIRIVFGGGRNR